MEEGGEVALSKPTLHKPKLAVAPRNLSNGFIHGGLNSATPTPMIFGSKLYADSCDACSDCKPFSHLLAGALGSPSIAQTAFTDNSVKTRMFTETPPSREDERPTEIELNGMEGDHDDSQSIGSAKYKAMVPSRLPIASSSSHFTISPGISPALLLESPVLFSVGQTDPSPTTGAYSMLPITHETESLSNMSAGEDGVRSMKRKDSFIFKPHPSVERCGSPANIRMGTFGMHNEETAKRSDGKWQRCIGSEESYGGDITPSDQQQASNLSCPQDNLDLLTMASPAISPPTLDVSAVTYHSNGRLSIDEYNWKKYGQKTLKNSENPRSYYKCTHPTCPAKIQVECSLEGKITKSKLKGEHNHAKPEGNQRRVKNSNAVVHNLKGAYHDSVVQDSMAANPLGDLSSASYGQSHRGLPGTPEISFTSPSYEDDENSEANMVAHDRDDGYASKRRRTEGEKDNFRATHEPRVVVQTVSEKDVLDDGYRWRKYGQKVVKGRLHPRCYYKCTNVGCTVRKIIERSSTDIKCVVTTYEGKHNHGVPPKRGSMCEKEKAANVFGASHPHSNSEGMTYVF